MMNFLRLSDVILRLRLGLLPLSGVPYADQFGRYRPPLRQVYQLAISLRDSPAPGTCSAVPYYVIHQLIGSGYLQYP